MKPPPILHGLLVAFTFSPIVARAATTDQNLRDALTFHASFDRGTEAEFAKGDRRLYSASAMNRRAEAIVGLSPTNTSVVLAAGRGRFGTALHFQRKSPTTLFFQAATNLAYRAGDWSGTVSLWLSTDPATDLAPGFCDPIQITSKSWNDAAFFVEFEKRAESIPFRLGVYADFKTWNPQNRAWDSIPAAEKPLLTVNRPPFRPGRWTHVTFTFEGFNSGRSNGVARLYLDGQAQGMITARDQKFTWDPAQAHVMLGLSYVGLFDELSLFDRALTTEEVADLYKLPHGVTALLNPRE
jgi:hypothetical protein